MIIFILFLFVETINLIALVTGANRGIGLETVRQLAEQGHTIYLGTRTLEKGISALNKIGNPENVTVLSLDVDNDQSIQSAFQAIATDHGRLDILVNNAGINYDTWHNALNADLDNIQETLSTNLYGPWKMIQTFLPLMQKNGYGRIVNVSSGAGAITNMSAGTPGYAISKTALNVLTLKFSSLINHGDILINSVCPGWVRTDMGGAAAPRSVSEGAETIVWAATLSKEGPNGKFLRDKNEIPF